MQTAEMFTEDVGVDEVARGLRVSVRSVSRWRAAFARGGAAALESLGPLGQRCRLSAKSQVKLAAMWDEGPAAHDWDEDQCWTGARVATLIGRKFHVSYSPGAAARPDLGTTRPHADRGRQRPQFRPGVDPPG